MQQPVHERRLTRMDDSGKRRQLALKVVNLRRNQRNDERRPAARENGTAAIRDYSARRRDGNETDLVRQRLRAIRAPVEELYLDESSYECRQRDHDDRRE